MAKAPRKKFYRDLLSSLAREGIPCLVGGGYAWASYTGRRRRTKDLDIFVRQADCARVLAIFKKRPGYLARLVHPHWLGKVTAPGGAFVDVIFNSGNGICAVDDGWFERAPAATVLGMHVRLTPVEEMLWSKAFIMERHRYDGADTAHLIKARGRELDWDLLLWRFGRHWPVLLSHLILFFFIYPQERGAVPEAVFKALLKRAARPEAWAERGPRGRPLCRGTLLSFASYLQDVGPGGAFDARLRPYGKLSARQIRRWTLAPKD